MILPCVLAAGVLASSCGIVMASVADNKPFSALSVMSAATAGSSAMYLFLVLVLRVSS